MKKHIKKKYQFQQEGMDLQDLEVLDVSNGKLDQAVLRANHNKRNVYIQTDSDLTYLGFIYNNSGKYIPIPIPDFTLVYFDFAYRLNRQQKEIRKALLGGISAEETMSEDRSHELYEFYGVATSCIINLFTSLEAFVNHLLPPTCEYRATKKNKTEIYDREQIQFGIPFMEKLKEALPQILGKSFFKNVSQANTHLHNLKELRDSLIHTKADEDYTSHVATFKKLLNFKYDEAFEAVSTFFSFYREGYIEPCPCDREF